MRLIDADALKLHIDKEVEEDKVLDGWAFFFKAYLDSAPTVDVDRPQGGWIIHKERTEVNGGFIDFFPTEYECSNCGLKQSMYFINSKPSNFCPNCGADMRERENR